MVTGKYSSLGCMNAKVSKGGTHERCSCAGGYKEGRFCPHIGWEAGQMGRKRPALCRVGDLSHERVTCRPEPHLLFADQRLVRTDDPALERWRQDLVHAG